MYTKRLKPFYTVKYTRVPTNAFPIVVIQENVSDVYFRVFKAHSH